MLGATVGAACLLAVGVQPVYAQQNTSTGSGSTQESEIVLPEVQVETTEEEQAKQKAEEARKAQEARKAEEARREANRRAEARRRAEANRRAAARREAEAAALARAEEEARLAAEQAAAAEAQARGNPYADPDAPFKSDRLANSRLPGDIKDIPRTVTTVGKEVLEKTGTTSVREIARNTPGVTLGFGEGGNHYGDNIYIRGFKANNDIYIDGVRDSSASIRETFNTEQVEVVKGPAGTVGGRGTTGGALDIVTKQAKDVTFHEATATYSDAESGRVTLDSNNVINDAFSVRFNAMWQDGDVAGRDNVYDDRLGLAVAAKFEPTEALTIWADYSYTRFDQMPDWGVPWYSAINAPVTEVNGVDGSTFYGTPGRDFQEVDRHVGTVKFQYDIDDTTKITNTTRYSQISNDYFLTTPGRGVVTPDPSDISTWTTQLGFKSVSIEAENFANVLEFSGEADIGGYNHNYLLGVSYSDEEVTNYGGYSVAARSCTVSVVNPNPIASGCGGPLTAPGGAPTITNITTTSLYAVDTIDLSEQWIFNWGGRVDFYDIERSGVQTRARPGQTPRGAYTDARQDTLFNWNVGLTYKPYENLSIYGAIATSMNPHGQEIGASGGDFYLGLDPSGLMLDAEENTSYEVGIKYEHNDDLLLTAAFFHTEKDNAREDIDPDGFRGPLPSVAHDSLRYWVQGIELGVAGKLNERINLHGGAVFMDSSVAESQKYAVGERVANIAHTQFTLLGTYDLTDELTVGARYTYSDDKLLGGISNNGRELPAYTSLDLLATYEVSENLEFQFNVNNVMDETNYDAGYRSGSPYVFVAPGREISFTAKAKF